VLRARATSAGRCFAGCSPVTNPLSGARPRACVTSTSVIAPGWSCLLATTSSGRPWVWSRLRTHCNRGTGQPCDCASPKAVHGTGIGARSLDGRPWCFTRACRMPRRRHTQGHTILGTKTGTHGLGTHKGTHLHVHIHGFHARQIHAQQCPHLTTEAQGHPPLPPTAADSPPSSAGPWRRQQI
jgi:hypothetical protein